MSYTFGATSAATIVATAFTLATMPIHGLTDSSAPSLSKERVARIYIVESNSTVKESYSINTTDVHNPLMLMSKIKVENIELPQQIEFNELSILKDSDFDYFAELEDVDYSFDISNVPMEDIELLPISLDDKIID